MKFRVYPSIPRNRWWIVNETTGTVIGWMKTRKEAVQAARMLAGWRGTVTVER